MKKLWVAANIIGAVSGFGAGVTVFQGLWLWAAHSPHFEDHSGFPMGWSLLLTLLIATFSGATGAVIGYALRQWLYGRRFVARTAAQCARAGAVSWPILGLLFLVVFMFLIVPLSQSLLPDAGGASSDLVLKLEIALTIVVLAVPIGLAIAILTRADAEL
mgnify:CR=1 FL=1